RPPEAATPLVRRERVVLAELPVFRNTVTAESVSFEELCHPKITLSSTRKATLVGFRRGAARCGVWCAHDHFPRTSREKGACAMSDDLTERDTKRWLAEKRLGRREFSALSVGATAALLLPGCGDDSVSPTAEADTEATTSSMVMIDTPDGSADAFF